MEYLVRHWAIAALGVAVTALACSKHVAKTPPMSTLTSPEVTLPQPSNDGSNLTLMLLESIEAGDINAVEQAVALGANVNAVDEFGFSVLVNALAHYRIELVEFLIRRGAVTNSSQEFVGPPINLAGTHSPDHQELLDEALLIAVENHDLSKVKELLDEGANVNASDDDGFTVLVTALASYELELVNYLVGQGATITSI